MRELIFLIIFVELKFINKFIFLTKKQKQNGC